MNIRDTILKSEVGSEIVLIPEWGVKIEVRQRTVKQQYDILDKVRKPNGDIDGLLLAVETILVCCYEPDTGELVFDPADRDSLLNLESSGFQTLLAATNKASGFESGEEAEARLKETAPDVSSSS